MARRRRRLKAGRQQQPDGVSRSGHASKWRRKQWRSFVLPVTAAPSRRRAAAGASSDLWSWLRRSRFALGFESWEEEEEMGTVSSCS